MVNVRILTIFPGIFDSFLTYGNPARSIEGGFMTVEAIDLRQFTEDKHRCTDDYPYGGGTGMVMKPEPIVKGIRALKKKAIDPTVILMTPQGRLFDQNMAEQLAQEPELILICGRYEGLDERVRAFVDREVSIGDYILSGGETAAMVLIDSICRLIPGVIGSDSHVDGESFYDSVLEYPQYTRPAIFEGMEVPRVLLEGHHEKIRRWKRKQALARTLKRRPDLLERKRLEPEEKELLDEISAEIGLGSMENDHEQIGSD